MHDAFRPFTAFVICAATALGAATASAAADNVCTVLADATTGKVLAQQGECDRRVPPTVS